MDRYVCTYRHICHGQLQQFDSYRYLLDFAIVCLYNAVLKHKIARIDAEAFQARQFYECRQSGRGKQ